MLRCGLGSRLCVSVIMLLLSVPSLPCVCVPCERVPHVRRAVNVASRFEEEEPVPRRRGDRSAWHHRGGSVRRVGRCG